jgi:Rieske Fe-S protein
MDRRSFFRTCAVGAGLLAGADGLVAASATAARHYHRARLVAAHGEPLRIAQLRPGAQYVFHYPYAATPCFLLNLGRAVAGRNGLQTERGERYDWPGGVGPARAVVAYSAICAHRMAHPTPQVSYISFRAPRGTDDPDTGVISCCAEESRYDPARGAQVLSGPAEQPLAAILLEHDVARDELFAYGTLGGAMFQRFFDEFEARLRFENPDGDLHAPAPGEVLVRPLEEFSGNIVLC